MIVILRRRYLAAAAAVLLLAGAAAVLRPGRPAAVNAAGAGCRTIVLDAGQGGEDGGAVSPDGVVESDLNLAITRRLRDVLLFLGRDTVLTRTGGDAIYSPEAVTLREKKVSDLKNRVALVNGTENAALVSIHQNSLPSSPSTHGAQVFWNEQPGAQDLAGGMQEILNQCINPERPKEAKEIADTIYLLKNVTAPGVIVECGFLSNQAETARLEEPTHQRLLAAAITAGYLRWGSEEGAT